MFLAILKGCLRMIFLVIAVTFLSFLLMAYSPIDPLQTNVGQIALGSMSEEQIAKLETYWGITQPPLERYFAWARAFLSGDMGTSLLYRQSVTAVIATRLQNSFFLLCSAWLFSGIFGISMGMVAGTKEGSLLDRFLKTMSLIFSSIPVFWFALLMLMVFGVWLKWFPIGFSIPVGMVQEEVTLVDRIYHSILPALVLSITGMPSILLHTREKTIELLESDFILFARAMGKSQVKILWQHGIRNIILPAITLQFAAISEIFGGSILAEQVFSYPGLGQIAVTAGLGSDMPLLLGITSISAIIVCGGNLIADILRQWIDPRIRYRRKQI